MRRKVKFQSTTEEIEDQSSIGLNSILDRSILSGGQRSQQSQNSGSGSGNISGNSHTQMQTHGQSQSQTQPQTQGDGTNSVLAETSVFSSQNGNHSSEEEKSVDWTISSLGNHSRRLFGRSKERARLRQAYRQLWEREKGANPTIQLALISGPPGCGKTALATSLRQLVMEDRGHFVAGKFDQMQSSQMYSAFVAAFDALVDCILARGKDAVRQVQRAIVTAVQTELKMLTDMIPSLERIIGPQKRDTPKEFRQSSDEISCFKFVFRMFVRSISSLEYPIVFLLDDLQFADEASLDLLQSLVTDIENSGILFVCTYREEKSAEDKTKAFLQNGTDVPVTDIRITNLSARAVDEMIAEIFSVVDPAQIRPLTEIIYRQTSGNVFYMREFLWYLQEQTLLTFDDRGMEWVWDERRIQMKIDFRRPVELMTVRMTRLPKSTREVLEVSACLGSKIDEKLLNRISPRPVFSHLQKAASRGFLVYDESNEMYQFQHDIIQEAAYKLIPYQEREAFHLTIGRELWKSFDVIEELEEHIFVILAQIREGAKLIEFQEERNDVAALCLRAGELAICSSNFKTASEYLLLGVSMLGAKCWEQEYELSLEIYNAAAEVEYCIANFDNVEQLVGEIFSNTRWFPDTLRAHSINIYSLGSRGHMVKAIEQGLSVLEALGEKFPSKIASNTLANTLKRTRWMMRGKNTDPDTLLRMRLMDDTEKIAAMQVMNVIFLYAYIAKPQLAPLISLRMVKLTLEHGLCDVSCVGFVTLGMLLCGVGGDVDEGYRCGQIALKVYEKFGTKSWHGRISAWFYGSISPWRKPVRTVFDPLKKAHRSALELGDIDFAMLNANLYCWESFDITTLTKLERIVSGFSTRMQAYGHESVLMMIKPLWQMVHNLTGRASGDPKVLTGEIMEQEYSLQYARENNKTLLIWLHFYRLILAYMFADFESAEVHASVCRASESNPFGSSDRVLLTFYDGLTALAQPRLGKSRQTLVKKCIKSLKTWSKHSPENFLGKLYFLEAELAAATGDHKRAHAKYTSAISLSKEGGYILQHALVNERAGKYFLHRGNKEQARTYLRDSLTLYEKWGGTTKVEHLKKETSFLF